MRACSGAAARHYTRRAEILRKQPEHGAEPEAIAIISPRPASPISPANGGERQATRRFAARRSRRRFAHLGKAIAMADKAGSTTRQANTGSAAPSGRLTQLHVAYGNALMAARGFAAPEMLLVEHNHADSEQGAADIISTLVGPSRAARIIGSLACSTEFRISYRRTGRCVLFFKIVAKKIMPSLPLSVLG